MTQDLFELVDERTGVIRSLSRLSKSREEPELPFIYQARLANFDFRKATPIERIASGKGLTDQAAGRGAIAEALERYCACQPDGERLRFAAATDLPGPALPPDSLVLYSERQYAVPGFVYRRPVQGQKLNWIMARSIGDESPLFVPASLVYMNFTGSGGRELFAPATSNGLAAGPDISQAMLAALYELIERDAFVITWLNRLPASRIVFDGEGIADDIVRHYRCFGIEATAFDITTDIGVPVIMALAVDRSGMMPAVVTGLGCHLSFTAALERALMEICQVRAGGAARYRDDPARQWPNRYDEVHTLEDHAAFAASPANLPEFSFLLDNASTRRLGDMPHHAAGDALADLEACQARLAAVGSSACYVDLTLPDIAPFVRVVRCLATGLHPIHFGYGEERLGGQRLFTVPRLLGYRDRDSDEAELNRCPHPLA